MTRVIAAIATFVLMGCGVALFGTAAALPTGRALLRSRAPFAKVLNTTQPEQPQARVEPIDAKVLNTTVEPIVAKVINTNVPDHEPTHQTLAEAMKGRPASPPRPSAAKEEPIHQTFAEVMVRQTFAVDYCRIQAGHALHDQNEWKAHLLGLCYD